MSENRIDYYMKVAKDNGARIVLLGEYELNSFFSELKKMPRSIACEQSEHKQELMARLAAKYDLHIVAPIIRAASGAILRRGGRFRNPDDGVVVWDDMVKGRIAIGNAELDDLVIARSDGTPTYNFCVVVDDLDMGITHVIRGDDHVNNTPRQINILRALGAEPPIYGHLPMINGPDGQKLSKRHGAVSVLQYQEDGYLPDAIINYLARLGWSHGDDEIFSREQLVQWFDGTHLSVSPAQLDFDKFRWVNHHYLKALPDAELAAEVGRRLEARGIPATLGGQPVSAEALAAMCALLKDRSPTWVALTDWVALFFAPSAPEAEALATRLTEPVRAAVADFLAGLPAAAGDKDAIGALMKTVLKTHGLKMPQLAVPLRLMVFGVEQTPSVDAMLALVPAAEIEARVRTHLAG